MSLYHDAASILSTPSPTGGSFKSRIYASRTKTSPAQIYALITEASKYDILLKEVIENAGILDSEHKLTPLIALFLVHDFLFARNGIVAPVAHPLRQAVEKHKTRLRGEFAKARVRRGCASVEELKDAILREKKGTLGQSQSQETVYPRWVRVNNLRTTLEEQLDSTFKTYRRVSSIAQLVEVPDGLYIDRHIPDLLAVASGVDFSNSPAYKNGEIILQDKASCFPAYLLLGDNHHQKERQWKGDLIDACAAPGNKTTHLASLLHKHRTNSRIISMDSSPARSKTLQKMITQAGADDTVTVLPGQDFLALDPNEERFANVTGLLLDPSCSGSGIVGRDDVPSLSLPVAKRFMTSRDSVKGKDKGKDKGKKRKRGQDDNHNHGDIDSTNNNNNNNNNTNENENENENDTNDNNNAIDTTRLTKLSNLQTHILERALTYPSATRVTYSTCSIHQIENEGVVSRVLGSEVAKRRSWRLLRRDEQPSGLREWRYRGVGGGGGDGVRPGDGLAKVNLSELELEACLRCWHGEEGLGGFFVVGFVRDGSEGEGDSGDAVENEEEDEDEDEEWEGFSD